MSLIALLWCTCRTCSTSRWYLIAFGLSLNIFQQKLQCKLEQCKLQQFPALIFCSDCRSAHQPAHQASEAQVSGASPSQEDTPAPQPMHKSQKDSMVQQQTAEVPSDVARQQGPDGLQRPNSPAPAPAPAFDSAAYAAAAAVRTSSPGASTCSCCSWSCHCLCAIYKI